jgi:hypothetical protein
MNSPYRLFPQGNVGNVLRPIANGDQPNGHQPAVRRFFQIAGDIGGRPVAMLAAPTG